MDTKVHFSSISNEWETPQEFFNQLNEEFNFDLDPCCTEQNFKCSRHFTAEQDGLSQAWTGRVFCNPPYGRAIGKWVRYAISMRNNCEVIVLLIPARTDTKWFHDCLYKKSGIEIRFIKGRLKFINKALPSFREDGNFKVSSAPFPSMIVVVNSLKQSPSV